MSNYFLTPPEQALARELWNELTAARTAEELDAASKKLADSPSPVQNAVNLAIYRFWQNGRDTEIRDNPFD